MLSVLVVGSCQVPRAGGRPAVVVHGQSRAGGKGERRRPDRAFGHDSRGATGLRQHLDGDRAEACVFWRPRPKAAPTSQWPFDGVRQW